MIQRMPVVVDVVKAYDAYMNQTFSDVLKSARSDAGLTQRALADALKERGVQVDQAAVARMEKGEREPKLSEAIAISETLGFSLADIGKSENTNLVKLHSLIDQLRDHRAREVAEGIRREQKLAAIEEILKASPELEFELSSKDRKTLQENREPF